jgi:hypothetical protein
MALNTIGDGGASERATSFLTAHLFDQWRKVHPEWRVIDHGCVKSDASLLEVPQVEVSGLAVGPVWFARRFDDNFKWMSSFLDKPIFAFMGGNFLRHFRVTLDYPHAIAYFEKSAETAMNLPGSSKLP